MERTRRHGPHPAPRCVLRDPLRLRMALSKRPHRNVGPPRPLSMMVIEELAVIPEDAEGGYLESLRDFLSEGFRVREDLSRNNRFGPSSPGMT